MEYYNNEEKEKVVKMVGRWMSVMHCRNGKFIDRDDECQSDALDLVHNLADIKDVSQVFLGGTCNNSTWRNDLIPLLEIQYFNPVVENWTPECVEKENDAKNFCNFHLYVITPRMKGVYSIAETMESLFSTSAKTIFCVLKTDINDDGNLIGFTKEELRSFEETEKIIKKHCDGIVLYSIQEIADYLNNYGKL